MKKHLLLASMALWSMLPAMAKQLSPSEALLRASAAEGVTYRAPGYSVSPVYTAASEGINHFYVFAPADRGFAILSADDQLPALLAYSDSGAFDPDNMPDAMREWLGYYQQQIADILGGNDTALKAPAYKEPIAPLITTKWNQTSPYNDNCIISAGYQNAVTGCVATAMAQVMNYHKWPVHGYGSNSYTINYDSFGKVTYEEDFSKTYFDWDNMLDSYSDDPTSAQKKAVATLMRSCGISVNMAYNTSSSGAASQNIVNALIDNFGYSKHVSQHRRDCYDESSWNELLYDELNAQRPIIYSGTTERNAGHSFVVDGYDRGYFHVNWGWGGLSDGYYLLALSNPAVHGTGGGDDAYVFEQTAITGISRPEAGDDYLPFKLMQCDDLNLSVSSSYFVMTASFYPHTSQRSVKLTPAVKITNGAGKAQYSDGKGDDWSNAILKVTFNALIPKLADDTYTLEFAVKYDGKYYDMIPARGKISKWILTLNQNKYTLDPERPSLKISDFKVINKCHPGQKLYIDGTAVAPLGYNDKYAARIYSPGTTSALTTLDIHKIVVDPTASGASFSYSATVPSALPAGSYEIGFVDAYGQQVSSLVKVEATNVTPMTPTVTKFCLTRNPAPRDSVNFVIEASMPEGGYFDSDTYIVLYDFGLGSDTGKSVQMIPVTDFSFESGDSKSIKVDFDFVGGVEGHRYAAVLMYGSGIIIYCDGKDRINFILDHPYVALEGIALSDAALTLTEGEYAQLTASYSPDDATDHEIVWSSTNPKVAAVDSYGYVTALAAGDAVIVASSGSFTAECAVTVMPRQQTQYITWEQDFGEVTEGDEVVLSASASSGLPVGYMAIGPGADCVEIEGNVLKCIKAGTVTVRAYQSGNEDYFAAESVEHQIVIQEANGITDIEATALKVRINGRRLIIDHKNAGSPVKVVSITGQTVYTGSASEITLPAQGIYIVRCEGRTFKVSVK